MAEITTYTPKGTYLDSGLAELEKARVAQAQADWSAAYKAGDKAGMDAAHSAAEAVRAGSALRYSGGADGSEYIPLYSVAAAEPAVPSGYSAYAMPSPGGAQEYIRELYRAQEDANINALRSAYERNVLTLDAAAEKLPLEYNTARDRLYGASEIEKSSFNERAAAQGLNSGAGSQARLSMDNALLSGLGAISREEAGKKSDLALQKAQLETAYRNGIAEAVAEGNLAMARELLDDLARVDSLKLSAAKAQADENYRAYTSKY
ncbi:MAG: hypothetical protein LBN99_06250 [Oscillospiraceae bacterium]|jgi:hypothetical protein|nr:hypothetical protein [Oscillospiraceae bacterium]